MPGRWAAPTKWGPFGAVTDEVLVVEIRRVLAESPFTGEGRRKVWERPRRRGGSPARRVGARRHPRKPGAVWGTDITTTVTTGEGLAHGLRVVERCTCECVWLQTAKHGTRFEALKPVRQGV